MRAILPVILASGAASNEWAFRVEAKAGDELEIAVYDVIGDFWGEGVSAKQIMAALQTAPKAKKITLRINSVGGILDDARAMVNMLRERAAQGAHIEARVDGLAASAASYLTTVAHHVVMPRNTFLMFHQARAGRFGTADEFAVTAEVLRKTNEQMAEAYAAASARRGKAKSKDDYLAEFAKGDKYITAEEALEWGLADATEEEIKVAACLVDLTKLSGAPEALRRAPYVTAAVDRTPVQPTNQQPAPPAPAPDPKPPVVAQERTKMDLKVLASILGLNADATEAQITEALTAAAGLKRSLLASTGKDTVAAALGQVEGLKAAAAAGATAKAELEAERKAQSDAKATAQIDAAVTAGQIEPARRDTFAKLYADHGQAALAAALEALPPATAKTPGGPEGAPRQPATGSAVVTLTAEEKQSAALLGRSEAEALADKQFWATNAKGGHLAITAPKPALA